MLLTGAARAQLTGEIPLSQPQYGPVTLPNQVAPISASDGTNFLVAWADGRESGSNAIYASRVTRSGEILDRTGIRVPNDPDNPSNPNQVIGLFHVDGAFTLFYMHSPSPQQLSSLATYAVLIGDDGRILTAPRRIFASSVDRMTSNGSRILALIGNDVFVLNGHAEIINRFSLPASSLGPYTSGMGSNGSTFLLASFGFDNTPSLSFVANLTAFDSDGRFSDVTRVKDVFCTQARTLVRSDGTDYLVMCNDTVMSVSAHAEFRSRSVLPSDQYHDNPALSWTGQMYLLAARVRDGRQQIGVATLDRAGSAIGIVRKLEPDAEVSNAPTMSTNGSDTLVAWTSLSTTMVTVRAMLFDATGTPHSSVLTIPAASNAQAHPVIATGGVYDLAVWEEATGVYATRVTSAGAPLDGRGILVYARKNAAQSIGTLQPRAIFDGTVYLVAWGSGDVTGQRIDPATGLMLGAPIPLAACAGSFDLGYDGKSPVIFVAGCDPELYAQHVDAIGAVGPRASIFPAGTPLRQPRAAWNGHEWLVVWQEARGGGTNAYFGRLSGELIPLDVQPILDPGPPFYDDAPQVASDGRDFVVVLSRSGSSRGVYLRHVHNDGSAGDATLFVPNARNVSLAWAGSQYAILYTQTCTSPCSRSYVSHFSVQDDRPVRLDTLAISESSLIDGFLGASGNGAVRVVYTRTAIEPLYGGSTRVFLRDDFVTVQRRRATRK